MIENEQKTPKRYSQICNAKMKSDFIFSVLRPVSLRRQTTKNFNYEKVILAKFLVITVFLQHF